MENYPDIHVPDAGKSLIYYHLKISFKGLNDCFDRKVISAIFILILFQYVAETVIHEFLKNYNFGSESYCKSINKLVSLKGIILNLENGAY